MGPDLVRVMSSGRVVIIPPGPVSHRRIPYSAQFSYDTLSRCRLLGILRSLQACICIVRSNCREEGEARDRLTERDADQNIVLEVYVVTRRVQ